MKGNMRDVATLNQLLVLANLESYNAILIEQGKSQSERLILLRNLAIRQMDTLVSINLSAVAEIERENIRVQTMEGRMQKAREGK